MPLFRAFVVLSLCASAGLAADLKLLSKDKPTPGELVSIDDKTLVLKGSDGQLVKVPLPDVLQLDLQPMPGSGPASYMQVELTDGTRLNCKSEGGVTIDGKEVQLTVVPDIKMNVPLTGISYILKDAHDPTVREHQDWKDCFKGRRTNDLLVASAQKRLNAIPGTFEKGKGTAIEFAPASGGDTRSIDLTRPAIQGCIFANKPDPNTPVTLCKLLDVNLNLIMVAKLTLKEGGDLEVTTVSGAVLKYAPNLVAQLDWSKGKRTFLSDLEATVLEEPSSDDRFERYRKDKNLDEGPIQLGGQRYVKGLAIPATTILLYKIGGEYKEFSAVAGIDEIVSNNSEVALTIEADGKEIYAEKFIRGDKDSKRRPVKLNIKDVQELKITVRPLGLLDLGQQLDLGDALISK